MSEQWHYSRGGNQGGPVSAAQLRKLAANGQLSPEDMVWRQGMADWVPARKLKGFFPPQPPPLMPPAVKFGWRHWDTGGKIIFIASCAAVLSMFMPWVEVFIVSQSGFNQGAVLFLVAYVYPFAMLFKNGPIHRSFWKAIPLVVLFRNGPKPDWRAWKATMRENTVMLFKNGPVYKGQGLACSILSVALGVWYIASKTREVVPGAGVICFAGTGAWLFLLASAALTVGVAMYAPLSARK